MTELNKELDDVLKAAMLTLDADNADLVVFEALGKAYVLIRKVDLPTVTVSGSGYLEAGGRTLAHSTHTPENLMDLVKATTAVLIHIKEEVARKEAQVAEANRQRRNALIRDLVPEAAAKGIAFNGAGDLENGHIIGGLLDRILELQETVP